MLNNENNPIIVMIPVGTQGTDNVQLPGFCPSKKGKVLSVKLINNAVVAASDTDYVQVSLKKVGGNVVAEMDSRAAHEGALAKNEAKSLNVVAGEAEISANQNLEVDYQEAGTVTLTNAVLQVEYYQY